jgi:hypothetical protein
MQWEDAVCAGAASERQFRSGLGARFIEWAKDLGLMEAQSAGLSTEGKAQ